MMKPTMKRSAASSAIRVRRAGADRTRVAAVLCALVFVALWLSGCESQILVKPRVTITAATDAREAGMPLVFTVRVNPAPVTGVTYHVEIDAAGCVLPERLQLPRKLTIAAGDEAVTLTVRTDGIEMGGEGGCALTVRLTEGGTMGASGAAHTVQVTVLLKKSRPAGAEGEISS